MNLINRVVIKNGKAIRVRDEVDPNEEFKSLLLFIAGEGINSIVVEKFFEKYRINITHKYPNAADIESSTNI